MEFQTSVLAICFASFILSVATIPAPRADWNAVIRRRREINSCQQPSNVQNIFTRLNTNVDVQFFLRQAKGNPWPYLHNELNMNEVLDSQFYGNPTCPNSVSDDPKDPLWMRSLCPWYYNVTTLPEGTFPKVIPQAICKCSNCIDNDINQCEQVHTEIRILQQNGCQDGFYVYEPKTIRLSVGCTCAKRRMTTSPPVGCDRGAFGCTT